MFKIKAKKRYINPLVETDDGVKRIGDISSRAKSDIDTCLNYNFDRYVYMDFNFNEKKNPIMENDDIERL